MCIQLISIIIIFVAASLYAIDGIKSRENNMKYIFSLVVLGSLLYSIIVDNNLIKNEITRLDWMKRTSVLVPPPFHNADLSLIKPEDRSRI